MRGFGATLFGILTALSMLALFVRAWKSNKARRRMRRDMRNENARSKDAN